MSNYVKQTLRGQLWTDNRYKYPSSGFQIWHEKALSSLCICKQMKKYKMWRELSNHHNDW